MPLNCPDDCRGEHSGPECRPCRVPGTGLPRSLPGRTARFRWDSAADWGRFGDPLVVSNPAHSTPVLSADGGVGVISGGAPSSGSNDRRLWLLPDLGVTDAEVYVDFGLVGGAQCGIARVDPDARAAVIVWNNIVFSANANLLFGVWEFPDTATLSTNGFGDIPGMVSPVLSAAGDGTDVTVQSRWVHGMQAGDIVHFDSSFGGFGQHTVSAVPTATSFRFASSTSGSWSGGTWRWVIRSRRRRMAVRFAADTVIAKQWDPGEPEPVWADPARSRINTIPGSLAQGGVPPAAGRLALLGSHLGAANQVRVYDLSVRVLGPGAN